MPSRTCCTVIAGVHFFPPPGFADQEPSSNQRERLMMVPAFPIANLVIGQSSFTLGALYTFLDAMFRLGDAGEFSQLYVCRSVGQGVVGLEDAAVVALAKTNHNEYFFMSLLASMSAAHDASLDGFDDEWSLCTITHVDGGPLFVLTRRNPRIDALPRALRITAAARIGRFACLQITNQSVRRNGQQVTFIQTVLRPANRVRTPHFIIPGDPRVRELISVFF